MSFGSGILYLVTPANSTPNPENRTYPFHIICSLSTLCNEVGTTLITSLLNVHGPLLSDVMKNSKLKKEQSNPIQRGLTCARVLSARVSQCRINYGSRGSPEPGPLDSGGLIISQK